jgi:hypothetical protein
MDENVEKFEDLVTFLVANRVKTYSSGPHGVHLEFFPEPEKSLFLPEEPIGYKRQAERIKEAEERAVKVDMRPHKHPSLGPMIDFNHEG